MIICNYYNIDVYATTRPRRDRRDSLIEHAFVAKFRDQNSIWVKYNIHNMFSRLKWVITLDGLNSVSVEGTRVEDVRVDVN